MTAVLAVFVFILLLGLAIRILLAIAKLIYCILVPRELRQAPAYPPQIVLAPPSADPPSRPPRSSTRNPVVEADTEPMEDEEEEEEESQSRE